MAQPSARACGGCIACCFTHEVIEKRKPPQTACQECTADGCRLYGIHPKSCRDFQCLWLMGYGADDDRPDKVGYVLSYSDDWQWGLILTAIEYRAGALAGPERREIAYEHMKEWRKAYYFYIGGGWDDFTFGDDEPTHHALPPPRPGRTRLSIDR
ncbi:MAG TPA: hypothetical protein VHD37_02450 [Candidatus Paceibacterota bacterium]|nr:hypothetical protein [Candidatus Paceibacterota bacterium]